MGDQFDAATLQGMSTDELKTIIKRLKLSETGVKEDFIRRILRYSQEEKRRMDAENARIEYERRMEEEERRLEEEKRKLEERRLKEEEEERRVAAEIDALNRQGLKVRRKKDSDAT